MNKDIIKQIGNTIALFGGKDDIIENINDLCKPNFSEEEVLQRLKNWNMKKVDEIKDRLDRLSKRSVDVTHFN